jgi:hypothetical protein
MKRKRQKPKSKAMAIIFAGLVALSMCTFHAPQLSVNAHSPMWNIPTQAYINVTPNPVIWTKHYHNHLAQPTAPHS